MYSSLVCAVTLAALGIVCVSACRGPAARAYVMKTWQNKMKASADRPFIGQSIEPQQNDESQERNFYMCCLHDVLRILFLRIIITVLEFES